MSRKFSLIRNSSSNRRKLNPRAVPNSPRRRKFANGFIKLISIAQYSCVISRFSGRRWGCCRYEGTVNNRRGNIPKQKTDFRRYCSEWSSCYLPFQVRSMIRESIGYFEFVVKGLGNGRDRNRRGRVFNISKIRERPSHSKPIESIEAIVA